MKTLLISLLLLTALYADDQGCPDHCETCPSQNICTLCEDGFTTNGEAACVPCAPQCSKCAPNEPQTCINCVDDDQYSDGSCNECEDPCKTCDPETPSICLTCKAPFSVVPNEGACFKCTYAGCIECQISDPSICKNCMKGFTLEDSFCVKCPAYCKQCEGGNDMVACTECFGGYSPVGGLCLHCGPGCDQCIIETEGSAAICSNCKDGFYMSEEGMCMRCAAECATCTSKTVCTSYPDGIVVIDGKPVKCAKDCKLCDTTDPSTCLECESRYFLEEGNCRRCQKGCTSCTDDSSCLTCGEEHQWKAGKCEKCKKNCLTCEAEDNTKCSTCKYGDVLVGTECKKAKLTCGKGCTQCSQDDLSVCTMCEKGHSLTAEGKCLRCVSSCTGYCDPQNPTKCLGCAPGFYLLGNTCKRCEMGCSQCDQGQCSECFSGFTLVDGGDMPTCVRQCKFPCAECEGPQLSCLACIEGYSLSGSGVCEIDLECNPSCQLCPPGSYESTPGTCVQCGDNCSACSESTCLKCFDGFYENEGACVTCNKDCAICVDSETCEVCAQGYVLELAPSSALGDFAATSSCIACDSNCLTCWLYPTFCSSCHEGYRLKSTRCHGKHTVSFKFEIDKDLTDFLTSGDQQTFIDGLASLLEIDSDDIVIDAIKEGSSVVEGSVSANSADQAKVLNEGIKDGTSQLGLPVITSSSVAEFNGQAIEDEDDSEHDEEHEGEGKKVGIIVGVVVGSVVVLAILAVVVMYFMQKRKKYEPEHSTPGDSQLKSVKSTTNGGASDNGLVHTYN